MSKGMGHKNWYGYRDEKGRWTDEFHPSNPLQDTMAAYMALASSWTQELFQRLEVKPNVKVLLQSWLRHNLDTKPIKLYGKFRAYCIESGYVRICPDCEGERLHLLEEKRCPTCGGRGWLPNDCQVSAEEISVD